MQKVASRALKKKGNDINYTISIIIPTFNRAKLLARSLRSILNQNYEEWEVIIIDNFSEDNTEQIIRGFKNKKIIYKKFHNNGSIAKSRNEAIKISTGNYIAFLDSDDWWKPYKLTKCIEAFKNNSDLSIIYHNCIITDGKKNKNSKCRALRKNTYDDLICNGNTLITSSVILRKDILQKVGLFNDSRDYLGWEDYDLWIRIAKANFKFKFIKNVLGYYWNDESSYDNPDRILVNLDLIEKNILNAYKKSNMAANVWWIHYTRGINYTKKKNRKDAFMSFAKILSINSPFIYKLKSFYYLIFKIW